MINLTYNQLFQYNRGLPCRYNTYTNFLPGEIKPILNNNISYVRNAYIYQLIPHFCNEVIGINTEYLYEGQYNNLIAQSLGSISERFNNILSIPQSERDNTCRLSYLKSFLESYGGTFSVMDIGSGIGIFPYEAIPHFECVIACDPDHNATEYMKTLGLTQVHCVALEAIHCLDLFIESSTNLLITLNQVLEHFIDPISILSHLSSLINNRAGETLLYIEVPEFSRNALDYGLECAAFYLDHYHVFSINSLAMCATISGFELIDTHVYRYRSGKTVIRSILKCRSVSYLQ